MVVLKKYSTVTEDKNMVLHQWKKFMVCIGETTVTLFLNNI
jgi:hypothetical protein